MYYLKRHGVELLDVSPIELSADRAVASQVDLVGTEAVVAVSAFNQRIREILEMP